MNIKKHIPNIITLGNLLCGTIAAIYAVRGDFYTTAILVGIGIVFDFFDGFVARLLQVQGEFGKQLDSLADMVTSGVVPGIVMVQYMLNSSHYNDLGISSWDAALDMGLNIDNWFTYEAIGLLLTLFAGYRLAKFNIDERQSDSFIGLPTPAMNLFVLSLPLISEYTSNQIIQDIIHHKYVLIVITILLSILMVSEVKLFSLKFKDYSFKNNSIKYIYLLLSLLLLVVLKFIAIPIVILLYVAMSMVKNMKKEAVN
ncbi:CDP-alcohol phosphatidyltransferase family protein [Tenacibaculum sp. SZ-18]|uniref:CDP-alcohol phosphatidyltransferase family protein n=1 Tax=Tenacibaculum sp. SZ-18 TaxID=754423 RepID=UPI0018E26139|nr:CDP-alcohol phosphatidyltransferase family protein [Tenacibaculum sp. SZ-18]